jgi:hypothetical protein
LPSPKYRYVYGGSRGTKEVRATLEAVVVTMRHVLGPDRLQEEDRVLGKIRVTRCAVLCSAGGAVPADTCTRNLVHQCVECEGFNHSLRTLVARAAAAAAAAAPAPGPEEGGLRDDAALGDDAARALSDDAALGDGEADGEADGEDDGEDPSVIRRQFLDKLLRPLVCTALKRKKDTVAELEEAQVRARTAVPRRALGAAATASASPYATLLPVPALCIPQKALADAEARLARAAEAPGVAGAVAKRHVHFSDNVENEAPAGAGHGLRGPERSGQQRAPRTRHEAVGVVHGRTNEGGFCVQLCHRAGNTRGLSGASKPRLGIRKRLLRDAQGRHG